jgi:RNA polymerase sigma-70 factor (ECF subfamily)
VTAYELALSQDVRGARIALTDGLRLVREMMSTAIHGDGPVPRTDGGGLPRTRQRPHPNEAAPGTRIGPGSNTRPVAGRIAPPGRVPPDGATDEASPDTVVITTPQVPAVQPRTGGEPPTGYPDRPDPSDAAAAVWTLIERAQAGDAEAFGKIYDRYFDTVFRFVYFRVDNRQLAEDLAADTFLRALKRIGSFTWQGRDLGAWLVTIARNLVADHFKSGRYRLEVTSGDVLDAEREDRGPEGSPESAVVDHITNVELLKAVKQLNPEQQECIVLRFLQGFSVAETAQAMGKNEGAIKALQYRAVRALARLLPDGFQPL